VVEFGSSFYIATLYQSRARSFRTTEAPDPPTPSAAAATSPAAPQLMFHVAIEGA